MRYIIVTASLPFSTFILDVFILTAQFHYHADLELFCYNIYRDACMHNHMRKSKDAAVRDMPSPQRFACNSIRKTPKSLQHDYPAKAKWHCAAGLAIVYRPMLSQDLLEGFAVCVDLSFHVADGKHVSNFNTYSHEGMYMNRTE